MQGPKTLLEYEDNWVTAMGAFFPGERVVFRGKDLFHELKYLGWMALLLYGITGRIPSEKQVKLFEGLWKFSTSYPDPRLWNNRVAALAGTTRSTAALAISAATAISEASIYGLRPNVRAIDFYIKTQAQLEKGAILAELIEEEIKRNKVIDSFGRPIINHDERIAPIISLAEKLGVADGKHIKLAFAIEEILLKQQKNICMNVVAVQAALAADQGFSPLEYCEYKVISFSAGIFPCYTDTQTKPEGSFFPLRCEKIQYEGKKRRIWNT